MIQKAKVAQAGVQAGGMVASAFLPAAAIPFVGPIVAGVTMAIALLAARKGPQQKLATTEVVNELEPLLAENLAEWQDGKISASQARSNFDQVWDYLVASCSQEMNGNPGRACVGDRVRGGQWDWFAMYRDPITDNLTDVFVGGGEKSTPLLLAAGVALVLIGASL